ncbi:MAG: GxxExxY protein [Geobacteraceae bacterium]|nr:GxxExxY protein [Geobacteraceae bacterium]
MLHKDLTEKIIAACFEVSNELGAGFLESVYEKALLIALADRGIVAQPQVPLQVRFRNQIVGDYYADIVVENMILLELKAVRSLAAEHQAQIINYLKATEIEVGLLVNFGNPKLEYRRFHRQKANNDDAEIAQTVF